VKHGKAAPSEQLQMALELTRARAAIADARRQRDDALARLAATAGVPIAALGGVQLELDDFANPESANLTDIDRLRAQALISRTDLERAAVDYDSREAELHQQVRLQYPQLSLGPGYTYDHGTPKATFGVSFTVPLFNHNQGAIGEAEARRTTAAQHVLSVQAQVMNEVDGSLIAYRQALASLALARHQADSAHAIAAQIEQGLTVGAEDRPTLLSAQLTANAEDLAALDSLDRAQQALAQLEDALRTPLHGRETQLNLTQEPRQP
jgi:outer membrane protein TolC